jgi:endo-1,3(4)-beta-glucanase
MRQTGSTGDGWRVLGVLIGFLAAVLEGAVVQVGSGGYTTQFPGTDIAGRNAVPGGVPQLSGEAVGRPVPTNEWWSALVKQDHAANLFNYPMALRTLPRGLDVGLIIPASGGNGSSQPLSDISPIVVGVSGLMAPRATVAKYSDWTVTAHWETAGHDFQATIGMGMPFLYFRKALDDEARVEVNSGVVTVVSEVLIIEGSQAGANFAVYAPAGSVWRRDGSIYTSDLAGKSYWSMAILPAGDPMERAEAWRSLAYVEPVETRVSWTYDSATSMLRTDYETTVTVHEGPAETVVQGLLPHQWAHLSDDTPALSDESMPSIRGEMKLLVANQFATERTFHGILPTLPMVAGGDSGFDPVILGEKVRQLEDESLSTWTDSYNEGQVMNRLIQTARIAHEAGLTGARDKLIATVKERLEDWLSAEAGEVAFIFHYQPTWSALIGYPAGHGQDSNLNDHHFHWGYFIHAAAFMEQFEPGWAERWGGMVNLLIRDAASPARDDPLFPFLRSFSPFAGHAWANGFATFPFGNDQESSSESMQFNSSLIHWGEVTGNTAIRDLGIYLYTTEQSAIEEYWLDINRRTFKPGYGYALASRVWGNGYDNQTFWTGDIAAAYGIQLYPIHGGSLYLAHDAAYAARLWAEMAAKTGVLTHAVNDNLWHDVYWQFLALTDPAAAVALYNENSGRQLKFGISDAQTYHWLHALSALGQVDAAVTADDPLAVAFSKDGLRTYVAHNYTDGSKTVRFSDGATLTVGPGRLQTSRDLPFSGVLETPFQVAPVGNTISLSVTVDGAAESVDRIELMSTDRVVAELSEAPYQWQTAPLTSGIHRFYARLHGGAGVSLTNQVTVIVGDPLPYAGVATPIPGTLEAGHYDRFEGAIGQGITYTDSTVGNNADFRPTESVDSFADPAEGAVVGWISAGEWLHYTVDIEAEGLYAVDFRYACGNAGGGGPLFIEIDGQQVSAPMTVSQTGGWSTFRTGTLTDLALPSGKRSLRIRFEGGELNLGRLTFRRVGSLPQALPRAIGSADAVIAPATATVLDASASTVPAGRTLTYAWEQVAGPAVVSLSHASTAVSEVSGLAEDGLYRFRLTVDDGVAQDTATVDIRRGERAAVPPSVSLISPSEGSRVTAGQPLSLTVFASDSDGAVERVDFYNGALYLGTVDQSPYSLPWFPPLGEHAVYAVATDSTGLKTQSATVNLTSAEALPCRRTSASGDFDYTFEQSPEGAFVTFEPARSGVGSAIVLFYHGTGSGPWPGQVITPTVPVALNATEGQTIGFYFTYSVPEGGERNTIAENMTYTVGACGDETPSDLNAALQAWRLTYFDEADLANSAMEADLWGESADPDADGLSNLWEFLSAADPLSASQGPIMAVPYPDGSGIRIRYRQPANLSSPTLRLQGSTDFADWTTISGPVYPVSQENGSLLLEYAPPPEMSSQYWRLVAEPKAGPQ